MSKLAIFSGAEEISWKANFFSPVGENFVPNWGENSSST